MLDDIIKIYTITSGRTITEATKPQYEAWAARAIAELESRLGWSLAGVSNVNVLGVSPRGCDCDIEPSKLLEAPEKIGSYRFFSFDTKQPYVHIDPFKRVNAVYLCRVVPSTEPLSSESDADNINVTILKTIKDYAPRYTKPNFGRFIKACQEMTICQATCERSCTECSAILVDADWITFNDIKDMLAALICDYIDWLADDGPASRGLQSEVVDGHSVGYRGYNYVLPYLNPADASVIQMFVGPYGMVDKKRIW